MCGYDRSALYVKSQPAFLWRVVELNWPVGWAVTRSSLEREVWSSNLGPVKSDTVLPTERRRCNISSNGAVFRMELCCLGAMTLWWAPQTRYSLWPNTASMRKDLILVVGLGSKWLIFHLSYLKHVLTKVGKWHFSKNEFFVFFKLFTKNVLPDKKL